MHRIMFLVLAVMSVNVMAASTPANPLLGTWEWVNIKNSCVEQYTFGVENTGFITSGEERSKAEYSIASKPTEKGFYAVSLKILEDQGGVDCGESVENNTGEVYKKFVMFHPGGNHYVSCDSEDVKDCVGPFKRIQ